MTLCYSTCSFIEFVAMLLLQLRFQRDSTSTYESIVKGTWEWCSCSENGKIYGHLLNPVTLGYLRKSANFIQLPRMDINFMFLGGHRCTFLAVLGLWNGTRATMYKLASTQQSLRSTFMKLPGGKSGDLINAYMVSPTLGHLIIKRTT